MQEPSNRVLLRMNEYFLQHRFHFAIGLHAYSKVKATKYSDIVTLYKKLKTDKIYDKNTYNKSRGSFRKDPATTVENNQITPCQKKKW